MPRNIESKSSTNSVDDLQNYNKSTKVSKSEWFGRVISYTPVLSVFHGIWLIAEGFRERKAVRDDFKASSLTPGEKIVKGFLELVPVVNIIACAIFDKIINKRETAQQPVQQVEVQPSEVQPSEVQPSEVQPSEVQQVEVQPSEVQPSEVQPSEVQPSEVQLNEVQPNDVQPNDVQPNEVQPNEVQQPAGDEEARTKLLEGMNKVIHEYNEIESKSGSLNKIEGNPDLLEDSSVILNLADTLIKDICECNNDEDKEKLIRELWNLSVTLGMATVEFKVEDLRNKVKTIRVEVFYEMAYNQDLLKNESIVLYLMGELGDEVVPCKLEIKQRIIGMVNTVSKLIVEDENLFTDKTAPKLFYALRASIECSSKNPDVRKELINTVCKLTVLIEKNKKLLDTNFEGPPVEWLFAEPLVGLLDGVIKRTTEDKETQKTLMNTLISIGKHFKGKQARPSGLDSALRKLYSYNDVDVEKELEGLSVERPVDNSVKQRGEKK